MKDRLRIAVLGEGTMGTALAHVAACAGNTSTLWCRDPSVAAAIEREHRHPTFFKDVPLASTLAATADLEAAVRHAALIIVAVPSDAFAATAALLGAAHRHEAPMLSATKGLDPTSRRRMTELLTGLAGAGAVGAIGGANITTDIMAGLLTAIIVGSVSPDLPALATRALETGRFRVYASGDLLGVELVSVFKNVAAVAVGIANGMKLGINGVSFVLARSLREVARVVVDAGGREDAVLDLCGIADLHLTTTHPNSLNRRLGFELGQGRKLAEILADLPEVPEGINAVRAFREIARARGISVPIADATAAILDGEQDPSALEASLLSGPR